MQKDPWMILSWTLLVAFEWDLIATQEPVKFLLGVSGMKKN